MARLACRGKQLRDELREQRARLLARAAPLEADVGAFFSPAVDAVAPAARPRLRDLDERGHARLAVFEAQELRKRRRRPRLLGLEDLEELGLPFRVARLLVKQIHEVPQLLGRILDQRLHEARVQIVLHSTLAKEVLVDEDSTGYNPDSVLQAATSSASLERQF